MKIIHKIASLIFCWMFLLLITGCEKTITDFGFDGAISGKVVDQAGNIVPGDITSTALSVKALGEDDIVTIDMRVKGDGTYQNTKLYPKKYRIWITGPVTPVGDTLRVDFTSTKTVTNDFVVVPFITVNKPALVGNPTATEANVSYEMTAASGKTVSKRELYCSTVPYPNANTGAGPYYNTVKVTLSTNSGSKAVTGLTSKTTYYLRIGAQASGATGMNFSDQITFTTP